MSLIKRVEQLEKAHRALHARHEALTIITGKFLPLIRVSLSLKHLKAIKAYDEISALMDAHGHDAEFQEMVRESIDELTAMILEGR